MLKLLTCLQGHYWETPVEDGADGQAEVCPVCGQTAELTPLLDLESSEAVPPLADPPAPPPLRDKDGRPVVAGYEILQDRGKGPTGVYLYRARQLLVNRLVTLKVVFAGDDPGQFAWGSLRNEAGALGRMMHPNIVQILDAGERDRQLFYNAVEHVDGPTLAEALDGKSLPIRQAAALVERLARAMHYAHEKNILHRNLKPASILLSTKYEGQSTKEERHTSFSSFGLGTSYLPKITDFGLARRPIEGDASDVELQGERPNYLAPEQVWGRAKEIGPATDVYALGAIFYELLTGQPPFRADNAAETLDAIQCREVSPPSRLRPLPRDLDIICRKCLAKKPRRRYASALELAEDLRRWADGYPIKARTAGAAERFGKWFRRNVRTIALVLLGLWAAISLLALSVNRNDPGLSGPPRETAYRYAASRLETDLLQARRREAAANYLRYLVLADRAIGDGDRERGKALLDRCPVEERRWEWFYLCDVLREAKNDKVFTSTMPIRSVDCSPDGRYLAAGTGSDPPNQPQGGKGEVWVWDLTRQAAVRRWEVAAPVRGVAFSADSSRLALVSSSEKRGHDCEVQVHNVLTHQVVFKNQVPGSRLSAVAFSPDQSKLIVAGGDSIVRVLQAHDGRELYSLRVAFRQAGPPMSGTRARLVPLSADGERIALTSPDGSTAVILSNLRPDLPKGPSNMLWDHLGVFLALSYDERSETLATAGSDHAVRLWNIRHPNPVSVKLSGHKEAVTGAAFSSSGERLASCAVDGTIRIWDSKQGQELLTFTGYKDASGVLFRSDHGPLSIDRLAIIHGNKVTLLQPLNVRGGPRMGLR
jgi:hypothetical protein